MTGDKSTLGSHLLRGLEDVLGGHQRDDGSFVRSVRLQGKRQASHQLHAQVGDGDAVIQDGHRLLGQDGVRERREHLWRKRASSSVSPTHHE